MGGNCTKRKSVEEYNLVMKMYSEGIKICDIVKKLNINRSTVSNWVRNKNGKSFVHKTNSKLPIIYDPLKYLYELSPGIDNKYRNSVYSYVLGLYLGDGCLTILPRTVKLAISVDLKYPKLNNDICNSINTIFSKKPSILPKRSKGKLTKGIDIAIYHNNLQILFPQHGLGKKHLRSIILTDWQKSIIDYRWLLKGLIMSDGSFYITKKDNHQRYNFSNCSLDIMLIIEKCLNYFSIKYCRRISVSKNPKHADIYRLEVNGKESVKTLKSLIGTKTDIVKCL